MPKTQIRPRGADVLCCGSRMLLRRTFWRTGAATAGSADRAVFVLFFCCFFLLSGFASASVSDVSRRKVSSSTAVGWNIDVLITGLDAAAHLYARHRT